MHYSALSKLNKAKEIYTRMVNSPGVSIPLVIYNAEESSELALKAILDEYGIKYE